ncbi:hypothetical protein KHC33_01105 [Methanospirillum sp. J.3.6.1-F.2.7.3]|uniref:Uncharacterized protein n=1 Tax=Methanospirillum purgamenti TaxID=2834276 RepID=A0A8E7AXG2_9EURY|nr:MULTISPECIES: hypothetical protein [Methanospirillum]MDX8551883.1 hypothetical protein [Methanospirillum hungatei]QVV89165.1 hypothetical protein KHC33_01105 [Methanospirillum sp. J.3.6.1-F.2.7.3]
MVQKPAVDFRQGQLLRYIFSPELSGISNLKRWVHIFAGDRCMAKEEVC